MIFENLSTIIVERFFNAFYIMLILNFNTKTHKLGFFNDGKNLEFENITTIKKEGDIYEVYQKLESGLTAPFAKFPVSQTVVLYSHE